MPTLPDYLRVFRIETKSPNLPDNTNCWHFEGESFGYLMHKILQYINWPSSTFKKLFARVKERKLGGLPQFDFSRLSPLIYVYIELK